MKAKLRRPYVTIALSDGFSTGGSQMWSKRKVVRRCGCGPVAAFDLLLYLQEKHGMGFPFPASREEYCREMEKMQRKYFPLLYPTGVNGLLLTIGLNRMLHDYGLPYRAFWAVSKKKLFERVTAMLLSDIPVILSVGPNFPSVWNNNTLGFYQMRRDGRFILTANVKAHYVTVLEITDEWIKISSWGRCYYIRIIDFKNYVNRYSNTVVSNIVLISEKRTS